jgi:hypothetical protein
MPTFKKNVLGGLPFTTIPDYFLAQVMTRLSHSELRVMLYIFLHTVGYGKLADAISYDQFLSGIVTRDGRRLDHGAGVKRRALVDALYSLEHEHGLISRTHDGYSMLATIHLQLPSNEAAAASITSPIPAPEANAAPVPQRPAPASSAAQQIEVEANQVQNLHLPPSPSQKSTKRNKVVKAKKAIKVKPQTLAESLASSTGATIESRPGGKDQDGNEVFKQVQTLPTPFPTQVQTLHLTRESSLNHENHKNRVAADLYVKDKSNQTKVKLAASKPIRVNQVKPQPCIAASVTGDGNEHEEAIKLLVDNVAGISVSEARKLVGLAFSPERKRDLAYLTRLVEYVTTCERIRTPAAVLTTLIQTDQDRTPTEWDSSKGSSPGRSWSSSGHSKNKSKSRVSDFGLSKCTYPREAKISNLQGSIDHLNNANVTLHEKVAAINAINSYGLDTTNTAFSTSSTTLPDSHQGEINKGRGVRTKVIGEEVWATVQEDLANRYRLGDTALKLLEGSCLEVEGQKAKVVLGSVWQERELGLADRSAIGLALRQRLGSGYELTFTTVFSVASSSSNLVENCVNKAIFNFT